MGVHHEGSRQLQDRFGCRRIADRLKQVTCSTELDDGDRMPRVEHSMSAPRAGHEPPRPGRRDDPASADALPRKDLRS